MKNKKDAIELSNIMKDIGNLANRQTICVLTNMKEPVGHMVGNSLEIKEVVKCLKGELPEDIEEIITTIGAYIIKLSGKNNNLEENKKMILENIYNGKAFKKFIELVKSQGGDVSYIEDINKFENAQFVFPIKAVETGYIKELNAEVIGNLSVSLGAGRIKKEDNIDMSVGIVVDKKIGDKVKQDEILRICLCK
jgi:pyrimidine-nucleoside phosphorylase